MAAFRLLAIVEQDEEESARRVIVAEDRAYRDVDRARRTVQGERDVRHLNTRAQPRALIEGGPDVSAQLRSNQLDEIPRRFAGRELQEAPDPRRHVHDDLILCHHQ